VKTRKATGANRDGLTLGIKRGPTLKEVADHLRLTKGTISAVLNNSPAAKAIPQRTKDLILAAARELNYRPNFFARTLKKKRTFTVGVVAEEIGDPYGAMVIDGIESALSQREYFFWTVAHRHDAQKLRQYLSMLEARGVEGFITVDTNFAEASRLPTVAVAGHHNVKDVTNIVLDHMHAAEIALQHLYDLGHRRIACIRGQSFSADSSDRWNSIRKVAARLGINVPAELTVQQTTDDPSPQQGYRLTRCLLERAPNFTAVFAYNDVAAIGAIRAIREAGLRVPEDISVVGFDDIRDAAYHVPSLTTVRQPLRTMGEMAAQILVDRIEGRKDYPSRVAIEPELVIRESTGRAQIART
jgi:DNA-binding LacI/PurR family transcriptional regulator